MVMTVLIVLIWVLTIILVLASVIPFSKAPLGVVRGMAFPREQWLALSVLLAAAAPFIVRDRGLFVMLALLAIVAVLQTLYVAKFTPVWPRQSLNVSDTLLKNEDAHISLISANVKKSNRDYGQLLKTIDDEKPDIVMAIEVDDDWIDALADRFSGDFPEWVRVPKDNGYGLCLMSRLPLSETEVRELIVDEVPSIKTVVTLRSGDKLRLYVVHPEPPVLSQDTKGRDSEIALVGIEAGDDPLPAIVSGDLNDVAWSTTTRRFQRLSGLLDPRVGRGFYNTFHADIPILRWPLDHLFHDKRFRLIEMRRLGKIGSDHFPMLFKLALAEEEKAVNDVEDADAGEEAEAREMAQEEKKSDRKAIGSDWEDEN